MSDPVVADVEVDVVEEMLVMDEREGRAEWRFEAPWLVEAGFSCGRWSYGGLLLLSMLVSVCLERKAGSRTWRSSSLRRTGSWVVESPGGKARPVGLRLAQSRKLPLADCSVRSVVVVMMQVIDVLERHSVQLCSCAAERLSYGQIVCRR